MTDLPSAANLATSAPTIPQQQRERLAGRSDNSRWHGEYGGHG